MSLYISENINLATVVAYELPWWSGFVSVLDQTVNIWRNIYH